MESSYQSTTDKGILIIGYKNNLFSFILFLNQNLKNLIPVLFTACSRSCTTTLLPHCSQFIDTAAHQNALVKDVSGLRIRPARDDASVVLRLLQFCHRHAPDGEHRRRKGCARGDQRQQRVFVLDTELNGRAWRLHGWNLSLQLWPEQDHPPLGCVFDESVHNTKANWLRLQFQRRIRGLLLFGEKQVSGFGNGVRVHGDHLVVWEALGGETPEEASIGEEGQRRRGILALGTAMAGGRWGLARNRYGSLPQHHLFLFLKRNRNQISTQETETGMVLPGIDAQNLRSLRCRINAQNLWFLVSWFCIRSPTKLYSSTIFSNKIEYAKNPRSLKIRFWRR